MSDCINCNPRCFDPASSDCIVMQDGNSLEAAFKKVTEDLISLDRGGSGLVASVEDLGDLNLVNSSVEGLHPNPFTLKVTPGKSSTVIEYDLRNALINSKRDLINVQAYGYNNGIQGIVHRGSSAVGSFTGLPENFPITLNIEVTSIQDGGQKVLKFEKTVMAVSSNTDEYFSVKNTLSGVVKSQKDVNELLNRRIENLITKVNNYEKLNFNGKVGLSAILSDLQVQINTISSSKDSEISSLKSEMAQLTSSYNSLVSTINSQSTQIDALISQVNIIKDEVGI